MKKYLKTLLLKRGYKINAINKNKLLQDNPLKAIKSIIEINDPIIFDVGANQGQTIDSIRNVFPKSSIHSLNQVKFVLNC